RPKPPTGVHRGRWMVEDRRHSRLAARERVVENRGMPQTAILHPPRPNEPSPILAGLTPAEFTQRHWQNRPLLIRAAFPAMRPLLSRAKLFALAQREEVESRLVTRGRGRN